MAGASGRWDEDRKPIQPMRNRFEEFEMSKPLKPIKKKKLGKEDESDSDLGGFRYYRRGGPA